ncbi:ESF1 homolog, partial [Acanthaster planci]|uniref:ESF1 homolog n=1 Tax=Acanthaster planci TaxID=133434 RepID=A0A8B7ZIB0_ACAPL
FAVISHDPRFRKISQQARKIKIDRRFRGMFEDDNFKLKYSVDKRGRPVNLTSNKHLRRFYELSSSEDGDTSEEDDRIASPARDEAGASGLGVSQKTKRLSGKEQIKDLLRRQKERKSNRQKIALKSKADRNTRDRKKVTPGIDNDNDSYDDSDRDASDAGRSLPSSSQRVDHDQRHRPPFLQGVDLARGQGNVESSSDSDTDSDSDYGSSDAGEGGELELQWGELDHDAPRSSQQSARLALCNMDWDRVTANDLLVLFNSFKPTRGVIHSVKIYPSDYGLEKMREEDARGPVDLLEDGDRSEETLTDGHDDDLLQQKLRKYQLQRLKYYYAVIDCDSVGTASALYDHCDGMEYQSSSTKLDLRFIPDNVTFDHEPKEVTTEPPDTALYKPVEFRTAALHQSRVELTWDETNHQRTVKTAEAFKKKNVEDMDVSAFLASSSDEDGEERWEFDFDEKCDERRKEEKEQDEEHSVPLNEDQQIAKYRALLKEADKHRQTEGDKRMEMEITWEPGLKDTAEGLVKKKSERVAEATPWEKFLEKKKEKKKKPKGMKQEEQVEGISQGTDLAFSDDELPAGIDMNDSFFKDALNKDGVKGVKKKKKTKGMNREAVTKEDEEKLQQRKSELELLFMDDDDGKKHFSLKQIMENEQNQGKKAKRKKKKGQQEEETKLEDDFEVDVKDDRFQALFTSHLYAMDPSDPQFKKTKATDTLLAERQRRRQLAEEQGRRGMAATSVATLETAPKADAGKPVPRNAELSMLVKSVKNKTDQFNERKLKRQKVN